MSADYGKRTGPRLTTHPRIKILSAEEIKARYGPKVKRDKTTKAQRKAAYKLRSQKGAP